MYVPGAHTVDPSHTQEVEPEFGALPEPQTAAGELPPAQKEPEGQDAHAEAPLFTI